MNLHRYFYRCELGYSVYYLSIAKPSPETAINSLIRWGKETNSQSDYEVSDSSFVLLAKIPSLTADKDDDSISQYELDYENYGIQDADEGMVKWILSHIETTDPRIAKTDDTKRAVIVYCISKLTGKYEPMDANEALAGGVDSLSAKFAEANSLLTEIQEHMTEAQESIDPNTIIEDAIEKTIEAMDKGAKLLYGGWLSADLRNIGIDVLPSVLRELGMPYKHRELDAPVETIIVGGEKN